MAEKWIQGILGYNHKNDRYGLLVTDLWEIDGFSCGNRLQVEIAGEWIDTHMEMDWSTGKGVRNKNPHEVRTHGGFALLTFASRLFHFALSII